jgi:hypothetical protein
MKKLICILASAALFGACEQKTEVVAPAASPAPETTTNKAADANTFSKKPRLTSETKTETKTETTTETTTTSSPTP